VGARARFSDLMQPFCCKRDDIVDAQVDVGGMVLSVKTKALAAGRKGDLIKALNPRSKQVIDIELIGPGLARVR
jgi:flagella basal body P-ring formation protein FlgA